MSTISVTAAQVRALTENGAIIRRYDAGGSITIGNAVYIASDGDVEQADGSAAGTARAIGIAVAHHDDTTSITSGDPVAVCVFGPVGGYSGMTPGAKVWVSDTAGRLDDAVGSSAHELGYSESASVVFVNPDPAGAGS